MSDMIDVAVLDKKESVKTLMVHQRIATSFQGQLALDLVRILAAAQVPVHVADQTGLSYQRVRMLQTQEVVERACAIAELAYKTIEQKGWSLTAPPLNELIEKDRVSAGFNATGSN